MKQNLKDRIQWLTRTINDVSTMVDSMIDLDLDCTEMIKLLNQLVEDRAEALRELVAR